MEYFGTMLGHGKPVTRKGTKKSGMSMNIACPEGDIGVQVKYTENGTQIMFRVTEEGQNKFICGTFKDFLFENGKIEG